MRKYPFGRFKSNTETRWNGRIIIQCELPSGSDLHCVTNLRLKDRVCFANRNTQVVRGIFKRQPAGQAHRPHAGGIFHTHGLFLMEAKVNFVQNTHPAIGAFLAGSNIIFPTHDIIS